MYIEYNPNPVGAKTRDCAIRAVARALEISWEDAFALIASNAFEMGNMMDMDYVWGSVLRQHGFQRYAVPNTCPDCYTLRDFAMDHPKGVYVVGTGGHVATIVDGDLYDAWDSSDEVAVYYWYKED